MLGRELRTWIHLSGVSGRTLVRTLVASTLAQLASHALAIGAPLLLLIAWSQHGWDSPLQRIAIPLVIIEVLAFLRSPLRFLDRMNAHRLGVNAVTAWRQWLTEQVSQWSFRTLSASSRSQLMQQSVVDIEALQNLWLRTVIPLASSLVSYLVTAGVTLALISHCVDSSVLPWFVTGIVGLTVSALAILCRVVPFFLRSLDVRHHAYTRAQDELHGRQQLALELALLEQAAAPGLESDHPSFDLWRSAQARHERLIRRVDFMLSACAGSLVAIAGLTTTTVVVASPLDTRVVNAGVIVVLFASLSGELFATWRIGLDVAAEVILTSRNLIARGAVSDHSQSAALWPTTVTAYQISGGIDFSPGQIVAVVGPSGSGKSTWLRGIARLDSATATLRVNDIEISDLSEEELRRHIVHVATEPKFLGTRLADEMNLGRSDVADYSPLAQSLGLSVDPEIRPNQCSRGERYRYAVVRALIRQPDLLILDEPTSALGDKERDALVATLRAQKCAIVVATHDPEFLATCDHVVSIETLIG